MREKKKEKRAHRCYVCDNLVGGTIGSDFEIVESRGQKRYYCRKCLAEMMKGMNRTLGGA